MFGQVGEFDRDKEDWTSYVERLQHFFTANKIEGKQRVPVFLTSIGAATYTILRSLTAPGKPGDKELSELVESLNGYFCPKPSQTMQRFKFHSRNRMPGESVHEYVAKLRSLSEHCDFGSFWDDMLRDRLVCGVEDSAIQKRLLSERSLDFQKALDIAMSMEAANREARSFAETTSTHRVTPEVHALSSRLSKGKSTKPPKSKCYRCNGNGHSPNNCAFKECICHHCKKKGHIRKACRLRNPTGVKTIKEVTEEPLGMTSADVDSEYTLFALTTQHRKPIAVDVMVDGCPIQMEVDTGASRSIISEDSFQRKFPQRLLGKSKVRLKTYGGHYVQVQGEVEVVVSYQDQKAKLMLLVVQGEGPSLMGRDWLSVLKLDWQDIFQVTVTSDRSEQLEKVLQEYQEVFGPDLGCLQGYKAKIYLEENATPKFCKARPVPLSMKPAIEKELDNLVKQDVLKAVEFSDWAAPIVPVLKSDKTSIRICGDFKVTINKHTKVDRHPIPKIDDLLSALNGGKLFTKLDLTQAYQQVCLDEDSRKLVVITTHKGLFEFNRMPFGIPSAPGIFQRIMESLLQNIPHVVVYLDDVLITGRSDKEHLASLKDVLSRLQKAGLRLKKSKCSFFKEEVEYLGYKIDANGIHPTQDKLEAIKFAPPPENVTQLKSYLGLLSYYGKFLPNLSQ